ncbi:MAG: carbohydrate kinase family protein [Chloroflexota bacterium]
MDVFLTGSVAYDYLMRFPGYFRDHILPEKLDTLSLSFLVDSLVVRRGGVAPNIAYTMALLGQRPHLMATVGEDFEEYGTWLESQGVDTSYVKVIAGETTASFFSNTDQANAQIASFHPGAMAYAGQLSFRELGGVRPDLAVISPNDPAAMHQYVQECQELGFPYFYDPSQQIVRMEAADIRRGIEGALALLVNDYEFSLIRKMTGMTSEAILGKVDFMVVTLGEKGVVVYADENEYHIPVVPPEQVANPTGVGDAFRGGFITGFAHGWSWELCGQMGVLAATYCLEGEGPQSHAFTRKEFVTRFRKHFDDQGELEALLG